LVIEYCYLRFICNLVPAICDFRQHTATAEPIASDLAKKTSFIMLESIGGELNITLTPIGIIHTPFPKPDGMPIQPTGAKGVRGSVEVFSQYRDGLKDLDGFSHLILIYHFHRSEGFSLRVTPFLDTQARGLFATRAPKRPNPIGLSIVKLLNIDDGTLRIENVDVLDGTPLLDIKPYVPDFDAPANVQTGWLEHTGKAVSAKKSDSRFKQ
jgi:tRNA (adenine37-N6)-methyltransferase